MAIKLEDKPNALVPSPAYQYGDIQDESTPGANDGTPINRLVYADLHQFFAALAAKGNITLNGLPDNNTNGFQYLEALWSFMHVNVSKDIIRAVRDGYTINDLIILHGCEITDNIPGSSTITGGAIYYNDNIYIVGGGSVVTAGAETLVFKISPTPNTFLYPIIYLDGDASGSGIANYNASTVKRFHEWTLRNNAGDVTVIGGTGTAVTSSNIKYKIVGNTITMTFRFQVSNTTVPTSFSLLIPEGKSYNSGINADIPCIMSDGSAGRKHGVALLSIGQAEVSFFIMDGSTLTNGETTTVMGSITFEVD
jgi:hypothetical protein